ncbi:MAG: hypothetical protein ACQES2_08305 [Pseudomonadota bacterium]
MKVRPYRTLNTVAIIGFTGLAVLLLPSFFRPTFEVTNRDNEAASITAHWRQQEKDLGSLSPGETVQFDLSDEAGMVFIARYPDGQHAASEPVYFSRGLNIVAVLHQRQWRVYYEQDHDTKAAVQRETRQ